MSKKTFFKNAMILSIGGIVTKLIGGIYRIPLMNILGAGGMGVYQLVFPFYTLLLTLSSSGIPMSLSKQMAEGLRQGKEREAQKVFKTALLSLTLFGLFFSAVMFLSSTFLGKIQNEPRVTICYMLMSPSVFFVALISAFRGYFQAYLEMTPTAVSQVIEQIVKLCFGLLLGGLALPDINLATALSIFAVSFSELIALIYLIALYLKKKVEIKNFAFLKVRQSFLRKFKSRINVCLNFETKNKAKIEIAKIRKIDRKRNLNASENKERICINGEKTNTEILKKLFAFAIPVALSSAILPLSVMMDSVLATNIIGAYRSDATALYGLMSGAVNSLISLPITLSAAISIAVLPAISASNVTKNLKDVKNKTIQSLKLTVLISFVAVAFVAIFGRECAEILYGKLSLVERNLVGRLLSVSAINILFLSLVQVTATILGAINCEKVSLKNLSIAMIFKVVASAILMSIPSINIYGACIGNTIMYSVAGFLNLVYIIKVEKIIVKIKRYLIRPFIITGITSLAFLVFKFIVKNAIVKIVLSFSVGGALFVLLIIYNGYLKEEELKSFSLIKKKKRT